jgi:hypothetical protein
MNKMEKDFRLEQQEIANQLMNLYSEIEETVSEIKSSGRAPLFIDDPEYKSLKVKFKGLYRQGIIEISGKKLIALMRDVWPIYLSVDHFLNNGTEASGVFNGMNGAGGFYKVNGQSVYKQTPDMPGKYDLAFTVPCTDPLHRPVVHLFGEDILALHHGYRDLADYGEIFSEITPLKFEKIMDIQYNIGNSGPIGTLWEYTTWEHTTGDRNDSIQHFIAKTSSGYKTISNSDEGYMRKYGELYDDSRNYLTQKYLHRGNGEK